MSVPYIPKITTGGQNAAITARENGFAFEVTHVSFGTGLYVHTGNETALQNEIAKVPIAGGGRVAGMLSLVINALLKDSDLYVGVNQPVDISEIGFWNEGVLFAIYANNTVLVRKIQDCYIANVYTLALKTLQPIDAANINVVIDEGAAIVLALLGEHLSVTNPHPQYATVLMLQDEALAREQNDLALSIALAAEITNRENAIAAEALARQNAIAQTNFAVFNNETTYTVGTHTFVVPVNVNRVIVELQAGGGGGGQGGGNDGGAELGGGGGGGASGQWLSVLIFNLVAGNEINITVGAKGLGGHSGTTIATGGGDTFFSVVGRANSLTTAKGGRSGARGAAGDNNGSNPSFRGLGGTLWGYTELNMRFSNRVADSFEKSGIGGSQTVHGGDGGNSLFSNGGGGGIGGAIGVATDGDDGTLGSGGGGGGGRGSGGISGQRGGDGGDGFAKVYW